MDPAREAAQALVERMIEDRAPSLVKRPRLWAALRTVLYPALGFKAAVDLVEAVAPLSADACFEWGDEFLQLTVEADGLEHIPESGPVLIIANHPGGIPDGNALWKAIRHRRPDLCFFANRDALKITPGLRDRIIPVEWRRDENSRQRARETLRAAMEAFNAGRCVAIFPAGRMADWSWRRWRIAEPAWASTGVSIARRFNAPVVAMGVTQRMPMAYYALAQLHEELRDITLFHGLMRQRGKHYRLRFAEPVHARALEGSDGEATDALKAKCEAMAWGDHGKAPEAGSGALSAAG
ncbi:MAG: 1-acyl-sn-glycerol-3-phosphate acyltransferase [Pseudomonadota bacterium]